MKRRMLALVLATVFAQDALAWGREGHETVGYIAAKLIKGTRAEAEVLRILKSGENLATAAEWPDCAKGVCGPKSKEMKDFAKYNPKHHAYHYTDVPFQNAEYTFNGIGTSKDDIVVILREAILTLQGTPPANSKHKLDKRTALFVLAHMIGDMHQPLHVGAAYIRDLAYYSPTSKFDEKTGFTQGGNWTCVGKNGLHSMWDNKFVEAAMANAGSTSSLHFADQLSNGLTADTNIPGDVLGRPQSWATESLRLADEQLKTVKVSAMRKQGAEGSCRLPASYPGNMWTVELPPGYEEAASDIAKSQVQLAGKRLAETLMAIWP